MRRLHSFGILGGIALAVAALAGAGAYLVKASDHDDGENVYKERNLNLTDVYAFREDWQVNTGSSSNLILVMNSNPRALPRYQYYFSTAARYEMHLSQATSLTTRPTGSDDVTLRFSFGAPDATTKQQAILFTMIKNGATSTFNTASGGGSILTTTMGTAAGTVTDVVNDVAVGGSTIKIFAGLRQDPFFFRVDGFFRWRALAAASAATGAAQLATLQSGANFTEYYNVNSIVVSVPISLIQSNTNTIFDVWTTISVPKT